MCLHHMKVYSLLVVFLLGVILMIIWRNEALLLERNKDLISWIMELKFPKLQLEKTYLINFILCCDEIYQNEGSNHKRVCRKYVLLVFFQSDIDLELCYLVCYFHYYHLVRDILG
jgi:hypothetical protein